MNFFEKYTGLKKEDFIKKSGIYMILNTRNSKYYIGSAKDFYQRWRLHLSDLCLNKHYNKYLQRSWNKYGCSNFSFIILEEVSQEFLEDKETEWITKLQATNRVKGYNVNKTGKTRLGAVLSLSTKNKIRKALTGVRLSQDRKERAVKALKEAICKPVVVLDLNSNFICKFNSITEAGKHLSIKETNISRVLKGKSKTAKGYVFISEEEYDCEKDYSRTSGKNTRKVGQFDKNNTLLKTFDNCKKAADSVGGFQSNVNAVCNNYNGMRTYKNFVWRYL